MTTERRNCRLCMLIVSIDAKLYVVLRYGPSPSFILPILDIAIPIPAVAVVDLAELSTSDTVSRSAVKSCFYPEKRLTQDPSRMLGEL